MRIDENFMINSMRTYGVMNSIIFYFFLVSNYDLIQNYSRFWQINVWWKNKKQISFFSSSNSRLRIDTFNIISKMCKKKKKNDNQDEILKAIYFIILSGYCKWKLLVYRSISQRLIIVNHDSFPVSAQLTKFRPDTVNEKQIDDRVYNFDSRRSGRD